MLTLRTGKTVKLPPLPSPEMFAIFAIFNIVPERGSCRMTRHAADPGCKDRHPHHFPSVPPTSRKPLALCTGPGTLWLAVGVRVVGIAVSVSSTGRHRRQGVRAYAAVGGDSLNTECSLHD